MSVSLLLLYQSNRLGFITFEHKFTWYMTRNVFKLTLSGILMLSLFSCGGEKVQEKKEETTMIDLRKDVHSFAEPAMAKVTHLNLDAQVNFDSKTIDATATWDFEHNDTANQIKFDVDGLTIHGVTDQDGEALHYELGKEKEFLGQPLVVDFNENTTKIAISYTTAPTAEALQWLNPQQTAGKEHPFLFSQSQAILARTWIPCQDSPGIRYTYEATVKVPAELMALMSAENPQERNETGEYHFKMQQPIPSYLMALTVGDIAFEAVGPRTAVYAEPSVVKGAAWEFADMEKMLEAAESLYGKYAWERYDLIVLPPSFPFGGMENPRLTFATPTVIAGDRSLTSLVAHEMAHSWSGNLVTNATWNDFWLNEGFTVYFERRIMEELYGKDYAEMLAVLGYQDLEGDIDELPKEDTHLKLDLVGRNPDDGMTDIAYEKGYFFLRMLEENLGREKFDRFLKNYFHEHAFQTMITEEFLTYADSNLFKSDSTLRAQLKVDEWIYQGGLPSNCPKVVSTRFQRVSSTLKAWSDGAFSLNEVETDDWSSHEWLYFLRELPDSLDVSRLEELDNAFHFTQSGNSEILAAWFMHTIKKGYHPADSRVEEFLIEVGRRKFLVPIYKALIEADPSKATAKAIYEKARDNYHAVSVETLDKLILE